MTVRFAAAALAATLFAMPALAQDNAAVVVGNWDIVTETPMGDLDSGVRVARGPAGYSVAIEDRMPEAAAMPPMASTITNVAVSGDTVTFVRVLETPQGPLELNYRLTVTGDSIAGEANSAFGPVPITGTRASAQ